MDNPEYSIRKQEPEPVKGDSSTIDKSPQSSVIPESEPISVDCIPTCVDHFNISGWPEMMLCPQLDTNKTVEKVKFIDDFIKERLTSMNIMVNKDSYAEELSRLEAELGLSKNHEWMTRINKIFSLSKILDTSTKDKNRKKSIFMLLNNKK
jgi:hypothetical protein